jgi:hypothetical protein
LTRARRSLGDTASDYTAPCHRWVNDMLTPRRQGIVDAEDGAQWTVAKKKKK